MARTGVRVLGWPSLALRPVRASRFECCRPLAGDRLIDTCVASLTHGITIEAAATDVWPWLVQMGAGTRAGWYSYDRLDNAGRPSAEVLVPALQTISVDTLCPAMPGATDAFHVLQYEPQRSLVLGWRGTDGIPRMTWAFELKTIGEGRTRLLVRVRAGSKYPIVGLPPWLGLPLIRVVHFVMQRKQLHGIARRVEAGDAIDSPLERRVA